MKNVASIFRKAPGGVLYTSPNLVNALVTLAIKLLFIFTISIYFQVFDTLDCYTFTDGKWKTKTPMAIARDGLGVASYDGRIYAAGGKSSVTFCKRCIFKL